MKNNKIYQLSMGNGLAVRIRRNGSGLLYYAYFLQNRPLCKFAPTSVKKLAQRLKVSAVKLGDFLDCEMADNVISRFANY